MGRPRKGVPSYRLHGQSGQAMIRVYDPDGKPRDIMLGEFNSPESRAEYARICAELAPGNVYYGGKLALSVAEVLAAFWKHSQVYYRDEDGQPTSEQDEIRRSLSVVRSLYAKTTANDFGPRSLATVREAMIKRGWSRPLVNRRVDRVKRCFRWAVAEELVPPAVYEGLRALPGLRAGRSDAHETEPVKPVPEADYLAALPHLPRAPRAIVELMRATGMRPTEACRINWDEIDQSGDVWTYIPYRHKNRHRGKRRAVLLGPRAQAILTTHQAFGTIPDTSPIFCAVRDQEFRFAELRAKRKTKVQPSQVKRAEKAKARKGKAKRVPRPGYTRHALSGAVTKACVVAGVDHWHPNQLRHLIATEVRTKFGLDHAQALLGHAKPDMSAHYAELEDTKARTVAGEIG